MAIARVGDEIQVNTTTAGNQMRSEIVALADGRIALVWDSDGAGGDSDGSSVRARIVDIDGSTPDVDLQINTTESGNQLLPAIAALPDGRFFAVWRSDGTGGDGNGSAIRGRMFNADGSAAGAEAILNTTTISTQTNPAIAVLADGRFLVVWQCTSAAVDGSGASIVGRFFNADGTADASVNGGNDVVLNTTTINAQEIPSVTAVAGGYLVTWRSADGLGADIDGFGIRARMIAANGTGGNDFVVNTQGTGTQTASAAAVQADGTFLVAWQSSSVDPSGDGIAARRFNADGTPAQSDEFVVNSTTTNSQSVPQVAALSDGRFVVVWQSADTGDGSGSTIRARLFGPGSDGVSFLSSGDDFIVNTLATGEQQAPTVTALADGRFAVAWQSADGTVDASGFGIRMQVFDPKVFIGTAGTDIWRGGALDDTMRGGDAADALFGLGGNDTISGEDGDDQLEGGDGDDLIFGGDGADIISGGPGRDRIYAGAAGDLSLNTILIAEGDDVAGEVYDGGGGAFLRLSGSDGAYTIDLRDDTLVAIGQLSLGSPGAGSARSAAVKINAAQLRRADSDGAIQFVEGNANADIADRLEITMGAVTTANFAAEGIFAGYLIALNGPKDRIVIVGDASSETITGTAFHDIFISGGGTDVFEGGAGDDTYELAGNASVTITDTSGNDTITSTSTRSLVPFATIENLTLLGNAAINGTGNSLANVITGNARNNVLDGGAKGFDNKVDILRGGAGNDTYVLGDENDIVEDSSGIDTATSTISRSLSVANLLEIENLTLLGLAANSTGNALRNTIVGNGANNLLNGLGNADIMKGLRGNDRYVVDNAGDVVDETGGNGIDTVLSSVTYSLANAARVKGAVENLTLTGAAKINATGNALDNVLIGNGRDNRIEGGLGHDTMTGGGGNDLFVFRSVKDSGLGKRADVIRDFDDSGNDRIDLSAFKGKFTYVHDADFTGQMQVRVEQKGASVVVQVNTGGDTRPEFEILLAATRLSAMGADDFVL